MKSTHLGSFQAIANNSSSIGNTANAGLIESACAAVAILIFITLVTVVAPEASHQILNWRS